MPATGFTAARAAPEQSPDRVLRVAWVSHHACRVFEPPDLFDAVWYADRYDEVGTSEELWEHFRVIGDPRGQDPGPYFDTAFYKQHNPDWADESGRTAVEHYLERVIGGEERAAHPLLDPAWYLRINPDVAAVGYPALLHFARHGDAEFRAPSRWFDSDYYRRVYLEADESRPFRHFVTEGRAGGLLPRAVPRSRTDSAARIHALIGRRRRPLLAVGHDARAGGAPIMLHGICRTLSQRHGYEPVVLMLQGGSRRDALTDDNPSLVLAEGWSLDGILDGLPSGTPVLASTVLSAGVAAEAARRGHPTVLLIQEMRAFAEACGAMPDLWWAGAAGASLVCAFDRVRAQYQHDAPAGVRANLLVVRPALFTRPAGTKARAQVRRVLDGGRGPVLIGAGFADHRKGFDLFCEAACAIRERVPNARFVWLGVVGRWGEEVLAEYGCADLILRPGHVADPMPWYAEADCFLLTSRQDPGPTVVFDAQLTGLPFVGYAYDLGMIDSVQERGQLLPPGALEDYVDAVIASLTLESPRRRRARGRAARNRSNPARYADDLARLLRDDSTRRGPR